MYYKNGQKKSETIIKSINDTEKEDILDETVFIQYDKKAWYDNGNIKYKITTIHDRKTLPDKFIDEWQDKFFGECYSINGENIKLNIEQVKSIKMREGIDCNALFR